MKPRLLAPVLLLALSAAASAWNGTGHMLVGAIAAGRLSPAIRAEADRLLALGDDPRDLFSVGPWADEVRRARPETANWHYTNIHFRDDGKPTPNQPEPMNVVVAIETQRAILADRTKPDAERAEALRWLVHLVGDVHQPMHATARDSDEHPEGDRGGNDYKLDGRDNLHGLWDGGAEAFPRFSLKPAPEPRDPARTALEGWAKSLDETVVVTPAPTTNPADWAQESFVLATGVAYKTPQGARPSEKYLAQGRKVSRERLVIAGRRLADLLTSALGPKP